MATKYDKSRGWLTIVYPESAPVGWWDKLAEIGCVAVCSPLHDRDLLPEPEEDGRETKKPHYHVGFVWDGPCTSVKAKSVVDLIGGVGCIPMQSLRGSCRYFCHMDSPDKAQYDSADVRTLGGLDYQELIQSASDELATLMEIEDYIDQTGTVSYRALKRYARFERPDWYRVISTRWRENVVAYQRSLIWESEHGGCSTIDEYITAAEATGKMR